MTYASTAASFTGRTNAAGAVSKSLHVFKGRKRNARPTSRKPARLESHNLSETPKETIGMEAFEKIFVASRRKFVATAQAILRNREDAEDAVQDAFLSAYRNLRSFEGRSALTTWFTRIVMNSALMIRRKRKSPLATPQPETSTSDDRSWTDRIPARQLDPEMMYAERESVQYLEGVIGKMKPIIRQAFTTTYYDELSGPEASALLGISTGTLKARLFRARRQVLGQARRALVAPIRRANPSSFFPVRSAVQHLVARSSDTSSLEASYS
jgi:RNA polymerase sigma-70 factor, ECF subfamily